MTQIFTINSASSASTRNNKQIVPRPSLSSSLLIFLFTKQSGNIASKYVSIASHYCAIYRQACSVTSNIRQQGN